VDFDDFVSLLLKLFYLSQPRSFVKKKYVPRVESTA
jgi:hypothetical protein